MVGLFVDHLVDLVGGRRLPPVRFGHISADPTSIRQFDGVRTESYSIDKHSRSSYSGSPVFVYQTPAIDLEE